MTVRPSTTTGKDRARLLQELNGLREALRDRRRAEHPEDDPAEKVLALVTFCKGMELDEWISIAKANDLDEWLALPCEESEFSSLHGILRRLRELEHDSEHDSLTGLFNRRGFDRMLEIEMERCHRYDSPLSLGILDLDDFKQVNDTYGHPFGDEVLRGLAEILRGKTRKINIPVRLGGEEFAILLPGSGPLQSQAMLMRLQRHLREKIFRSDGDEIVLTFSAGVACYRGESDMSVEEFVNRADEALYRAKHEGKDRIVCAAHPLRRDPRETMVGPDEKAFLLSGDEEKSEVR